MGRSYCERYESGVSTELVFEEDRVVYRVHDVDGREVWSKVVQVGGRGHRPKWKTQAAWASIEQEHIANQLDGERRSDGVAPHGG